MKRENQVSPVHPKFSDTFSDKAFPMPGVYCTVPGVPFISVDIAETVEYYRATLAWPASIRADWQLTNRNLVVFGKQTARTFFVPDDANPNAITIEQSGERVTITVQKRSR